MSNVKGGIYLTIEISDLIQLVYAWTIIVISIYAHEIGHYIAMKHHFPNADSIKFVWTGIFLIPVPCKVVSGNLNKNVTVKQALMVISMGPIVGFAVMIILSYFLLDMDIFIAVFITEIFASRGDFKKIYITIKEEQEKRKANQGI